MFLFNNPKSFITPFGGPSLPMPKNKPSTYERLTGEEKPGRMAVLLLLLTSLLHLWLGLWLLKAKEEDKKIIPPKIMEVLLVAQPEEMSAPPIPQAQPPKPVPPKKPPEKKVVKKKIPVLKKPAEIPKEKVNVEEKMPDLPPEVPSTPAPPSPPAPPVAKPVSKPATKPGTGNATKPVSSGVVPLVRVKPKYPSRALSRRIEGWVKIEFTISPSGSVTNAAVVASEPPEIFDEEALKAIKKWEFKEKIVNGVAVEQRAFQLMTFTLPH